jgi:hypothetical protein
MTNDDLLRRVQERSAADAAFRATALCDPVAALAWTASAHACTVDAAWAETVIFVPVHRAATPAPEGMTVVVVPDAEAGSTRAGEAGGRSGGP